MTDAVELLDSICERIGCKEWPQYRNLAASASASAQPRLCWVFEQPDESPWYRTTLCRKGASCSTARCFFAHGQAQLRRIPPYTPAGTDTVYCFEACVRVPAKMAGDNGVLRARGEADCATLAAAREEAASTLLREMLRRGLDTIGDAPASGSATSKMGPPLRAAELQDVVEWLCTAAKTDGALALALLEADPLAWLRELWAMLADEQPKFLARVITSAPACFSAFDRDHCGPVRAAAKLTAERLGSNPRAAAPTAVAASSSAAIASLHAPVPLATATPPHGQPTACAPALRAHAQPTAPAPSRPAPALALHELEARALSFIMTSTMVRRSAAERYVRYERAPGESLHPLILAELAEPSSARLARDEWVSVPELAWAISSTIQTCMVNPLFVALYVAEFEPELEIQTFDTKRSDVRRPPWNRPNRPCAVRRRLPLGAANCDDSSASSAHAPTPARSPEQAERYVHAESREARSQREAEPGSCDDERRGASRDAIATQGERGRDAPAPASPALAPAPTPPAPELAPPPPAPAPPPTASTPQAPVPPPPVSAPLEPKPHPAQPVNDDRVSTLEATLAARTREKRELMCRLCTQRPRECLLLPCRHLLFCMRCAKIACAANDGARDADAERHCPVCQAAVAKMLECALL